MSLLAGLRSHMILQMIIPILVEHILLMNSCKGVIDIEVNGIRKAFYIITWINVLQRKVKDISGGLLDKPH